MAEDKKSFVLYSDNKELWEEITDEQAGKLIKHIFRYVNDENPTAPDEMTKLLFIPIKATLKRDLKKYEQKKEDKSNAGVVGNLKRWHPELYKKYRKSEISLQKALKIAEDRKTSQSEKKVAKIAVSDSDSVSVNVSANVNDIDDDVLYPVTTLFSLYFANPKLVKAVLDNNSFTSEEALKKRVEQFNRHLSETGQFAKTWKDYTTHFLNWHKKALNGTSVRKSPTDITL